MAELSGGAAKPRMLLVLASIAVGFAAADTYVVVLALPDMMSSVGLGIDQLQRAAPVISGFLLGYVAVLPLIGRVSDLRGRIPVLLGSLAAFSVGSLVTAGSYDLTAMVIGRFLQGLGGGGLVPVTLALVAELWPAERRAVPLGIVGAVQELGAVIGPLYGAAVLAVWSWRAIFWINLVVGLGLAAALIVLGRGAARDRPRGRPARFDWVGLAMLVLSTLALALVLTQPSRLVAGVHTGLAFVPQIGTTRWTAWVALVGYGCLLLFVLRVATAERPLVEWRGWAVLATSADLPGSALLAGALAGIVLAFATADPKVQVLAPAGPWLLAASALLLAGFGWRQRRTEHPLLPGGALTAPPAWGALVASLFTGAALVAALVDIPVFARATVYPDSQLDAALVLVRLLVAVPVGAVLGGWLSHRTSNAVVAAAGLALSAIGFVLMTTWGLDTLRGVSPTFVLLATGLGFGLAIAPTNAALLAATADAVHGVASALLVVARMVGMLVGISALTEIGLRRFYSVSASQPTLHAVCHSDTLCHAYEDQVRQAGIVQLHTVFWGAAGCAAVAALLSAALLSRGSAATASSEADVSASA